MPHVFFDQTKQITMLLSSSKINNLWGNPQNYWITAALLLVTFMVYDSMCETFTAILLAPAVPYELIPGSFPYYLTANSSVAAAAFAVKTITDNNLLPNDNINITWVNIECSKRGGVIASYQVFVEKKYKPDVILGPPCTEAMKYAGEVGGYRNVSMYGWVANFASFSSSNKEIYNTLINTYGPARKLGDAVLGFLNYMDWHLVTMISTDEKYYVARDISGAIERSEVDLVQWYDTASYTPADTILLDSSIHARIVLLIVEPSRSSLTDWLVAASRLGMTFGDYVFILATNRLVSDDLLNDLQPDLSDATRTNENDYAAGFKNLLILSQATYFFDDFDTFSSSALREATAQVLDSIGLGDVVVSSTLDLATPFLHDSLVLWAVLVNKSRENFARQGVNNPTKRQIVDGNRLMTMAYQSSELSHSFWRSGEFVLDNNNDRQPRYWIRGNGPDGLHIILSSRLEEIFLDNFSYIFDTSGEFYWGDGSIGYDNRPSALPVCGFYGEFCQDKTAEVVLLVVVLGIAVLVIALFFIIRKYQHERYLKHMTWKIDEKDLFDKDDKNRSRTTLRSLKINASDVGKSYKSKDSISLRSKKSAKALTHSSRLVGTLNGTVTSYDGQTFIRVAIYNENICAIKTIKKATLNINRNLQIEMSKMMDIKHANIAQFYGATVKTPELLEVWQYCTKGSVYDIIFNESIKLDSMFKFSLASDILQGLKYLHSGPIVYHGNLKSSNCVVDGRWVCKLTDYNLREFHVNQEFDKDVTSFALYAKLYWTSPEHLKAMPDLTSQERPPGSKEGDIFAAAIIMKEIFARNGPYTEFEEELQPQDIIDRVKDHSKKKGLENPFRPMTTAVVKEALPAGLIELMESGWDENPSSRPSAHLMASKLQKINPDKSRNVMDNIAKKLEAYTTNLEGLVQERSKQVEEEKKRSEKLLYRLLPESVAESLKCGNQVVPEKFDAASIYFSDIVMFTAFASQSTPMQVVETLNKVYTEFDTITNKYDVYKVETIGDAYMFVSGVPLRNGDNHPDEVVACALEILSSIDKIKVTHIENYKLQMRIGIHSGPVVAGVVGLTMPRYCLFGNTVRYANYMESSGVAMKVQISEETYNLLKHNPCYIFEAREPMDFEGKPIQTYLVDRSSIQRESKVKKSVGGVTAAAPHSGGRRNSLKQNSPITVKKPSKKMSMARQKVSGEREKKASKATTLNSETDEIELAVKERESNIKNV